MSEFHAVARARSDESRGTAFEKGGATSAASAWCGPRRMHHSAGALRVAPHRAIAAVRAAGRVNRATTRTTLLLSEPDRIGPRGYRDLVTRWNGFERRPHMLARMMNSFSPLTQLQSEM